MLSGKYDNEKESDLNGYKFSLIKKVANSCLFNKVKLVKNEAKHVGESINNREMIFVENNFINQRIFLKIKNNIDKIKILKNYNNDNNKNRGEELYKTPRINNKKIKVHPVLSLKKNSKRILTAVKKIKKPNYLLNIKELNNNKNISKNNFVNKSQKLKLKNLNLQTENSKNYIANYNTERTKKLSLNKEKEDLEDFNNYPSKYPRLPTLDELQKIRNNNYLKTTGTNYTNRENDEKTYFENDTNKIF